MLVGFLSSYCANLIQDSVLIYKSITVCQRNDFACELLHDVLVKDYTKPSVFPLTWNRGRQRGDDVLYWITESLGSIGEKNLFKVGAFCRSRCQKFEGHLSALHMEECASVAEEEMTIH